MIGLNEIKKFENNEDKLLSLLIHLGYTPVELLDNKEIVHVLLNANKSSRITIGANNLLEIKYIYLNDGRLKAILNEPTDKVHEYHIDDFIDALIVKYSQPELPKEPIKQEICEDPIESLIDDFKWDLGRLIDVLKALEVDYRTVSIVSMSNLDCSLEVETIVFGSIKSKFKIIIDNNYKVIEVKQV